MTLRYASLLCGIVLIAAVPVLADRMSDYRYSNDSDYAKNHAGLNNARDVRHEKSSLALVTLFTPSSDSDSSSVKLGDSGSFGRDYSTSDSGKAWGKERDGDRDTGRDKLKGGAPIAVPEPGSLSLMLIGLVGIGVLAHRRAERQKPISAVRGL